MWCTAASARVERICYVAEDALLQENNLIVAGHYDEGAELKTLAEVHGANGHVRHHSHLCS
jgi:hypothetical protein